MRFRPHNTIQEPRLLPQIHRLGLVERRYPCNRHTRMRQFINRRAQILFPLPDIGSQREINGLFTHARSPPEPTSPLPRRPSRIVRPARSSLHLPQSLPQFFHPSPAEFRPPLPPHLSA